MAPRTTAIDGTPPSLRGLPHVPPIRTLPELHCELRSVSSEYALAALNAFVAPKFRFVANHAFVERSLDQAQRAFPEHHDAFTRIRAAYGIRLLPAPVASSSRSRSQSTSMQQSRFRDFAEQQAATRELHSRLRDGSHADAVTALDNFLVDAVSDWDAQFAMSTVDDAERVFQEHAEAFAYIRSEWHLPPLASGSLPVTPTSSMMPRSPILSPDRPLSPASPRLGSSLKLPPNLRLDVQERPPEYAKDDPDPGSTRLLEQRLAAEADETPAYGLGMTFLFPFPAPTYVPMHDLDSDREMSPPPEREEQHVRSDPEDDDDDDSSDENDDGGNDGRGRGDVNANVARSMPAALGAPLARQESSSNPIGPTYTFTAEELAGVHLRPRSRRHSLDVAPRRLTIPRREPARRTPEIRRADEVRLEELHRRMQEPPGRYEESRRLEEARRAEEARRYELHRRMQEPPGRYDELRRAEERERRDEARRYELHRRMQEVPSRSQEGHRRPSEVHPRSVEPPIFTFTADELAGIRAPKPSMGSHKWKNLLPRRVSVPVDAPPKLFRSLSRGDR